MKRKMKFRVWDEVGKNMLNWNVLTQSAFNRKEGCLMYKSFTSDTLIPMAFTGIQDINDIEIYEGDILLFSRFFLGKKEYKGVVVFKNGCFIIEPSISLIATHIVDHKAEVIGNIYETPELL